MGVSCILGAELLLGLLPCWLNLEVILRWTHNQCEWYPFHLFSFNLLGAHLVFHCGIACALPCPDLRVFLFWGGLWVCLAFGCWAASGATPLLAQFEGDFKVDAQPM